MAKNNYQYGTSPRKLEPERKKNTKTKKQIQKQIKINEIQKKHAMQIERKMHNKNVALILAMFLLLLVVSYRSSLINEKFNALQNAKQKLASIEKTNGQLEVNIESSLNLSNIEESAKEKLGMQKLDNNQKVYVNLDKKDYVEVGSQDAEITNEETTNWFEKIINKIFGN